MLSLGALLLHSYWSEIIQTVELETNISVLFIIISNVLLLLSISELQKNYL